MSIIRVRKQRGYTAIPDATLRDPRFQSLRGLSALGLLVRLLSRPDGWEVRPGPLARECGVGRDALRAMLALIGHAGYLIRRRSRNDRGRWDWESEVYDTPQLTIAGFSGDGETVDGPAVAGHGGDISNTDSSITDLSNTHHSSGSGDNDLTWPVALTAEQRRACESEIEACLPERRADLVHELARRMTRRDLERLVLPHVWLRAVAKNYVPIAQASTLTDEQCEQAERDYCRRLRESREQGDRKRADLLAARGDCSS